VARGMEEGAGVGMVVVEELRGKHRAEHGNDGEDLSWKAGKEWDRYGHAGPGVGWRCCCYFCVRTQGMG